MGFSKVLKKLRPCPHPTAQQLARAERISCVALARGKKEDPREGSCLLRCRDAHEAEAALGLIPGVLGVEVCLPTAEAKIVRVLYDTAATAPETISKQTGLPVLDASGAAPYRPAPPELQRQALRRTPLAPRWLPAPPPSEGHSDTYVSFNGPRDADLFALRLNAYCGGYGTEEEVQADAAYLPEVDCKVLLQLWAEKRNTVTTP